MYIQWFPGHMTKAIRLMEDNLRLVDAVVYVLDARAVKSCLNPLFRKLVAGKPALYVFNKCDLVEPRDLDGWERAFAAEGKTTVRSVGISGDCSKVVAGVKAVAAAKLDRFREKGAEVNVRTMVVGVPNSGKSTIINAVCGRAKTVTGDRPGVTRGKQWVSIDGIDLLDTPGTLWGKFEDQTVAHHLAYIGSIRDEVLDVAELACDFAAELKEEYPDALLSRYFLPELADTPSDILVQIAEARGCKARGGEPDYDRAARILIDDFRKGRLGKLMLEKAESGVLRLKNQV